MDERVVLREVSGGAGVQCDQILKLLPTWFGIPEANQNYVEMADTHPGVIASVGDDDVGIATIKHHSPYAAEIYLMAVSPRSIGMASADSCWAVSSDASPLTTWSFYKSRH